MGNASANPNARCGAAAPTEALVAYLGAQDLARLEAACRDHVTVVRATTPEQAANTFRNDDNINTLVVGDDRPASTLPLLAEIAVSRPDITVVAFVDYDANGAEMCRTLALVGVHQFIFRKTDTSRFTIRTILSDAWMLRLSARLEVSVTACLPVALESFAHCALRYPECAATISGVASLLGVNRRTLAGRCRNANLPHPSELLTICRLALAVRILERSTRTVEAVALELGFASATSLRNQLKRHFGSRATELRSQNGSERILLELRRRVGSVTRDAIPCRPRVASAQPDVRSVEQSARRLLALGCFYQHADEHIVDEAAHGIDGVIRPRDRRGLVVALRRQPARLVVLPVTDSCGLPTIPIARRCAAICANVTIAIFVPARYDRHRPIAEALLDGIEVMPASSPDELRRHIDRLSGYAGGASSHTVTHPPNRIQHFMHER